MIAYDVDFSGRRPDDRSLAEAIYGARRRVVVAADATAPGGRVQVLGGNDVLSAIGAQPGYSAFAPDSGGVIRHPLYAVDGVKSFAVAAAETATGRPIAATGSPTRGSTTTGRRARCAPCRSGRWCGTRCRGRGSATRSSSSG